MEFISREEAKSRGVLYYFTGKPCKNGHVSKRYVTDHKCCECNRLKQINQTEEQKTRHREMKRLYRSSPEGKKCTLEYLQRPDVKARRKTYAKPTPQKNRRAALKFKYGLSDEQVSQMSAAQGDLCAICGKHASSPTNRWGRLNVDHCHKTGVIRALLCSSCNQGLGMFSEDISTLEKAVAYLRRYDRG